MIERLKLLWHRREDEAWNEGDPLVSVYIPTHNRSDLLWDRALKSVLVQTYHNLDVVVVAHGCTDHTGQQVWAHGLVDDSRLRIVEIVRTIAYPPTAENHWYAGRVEPANAGLEACRGKWIATIDDDDVWEPDHIESVLRFAQKHDLEFVSAAGDTHKGPIPPYDVHGVTVGPLQTWLYRDYLKFMRFNPNCWKKNWNKVCDTDLQDRFVRAGVRMGYLDKVNVHVRPRPGEKTVGLAAYRQNRTAIEKHYA